MGVWGFDGKARRAQHRLGIIKKKLHGLSPRANYTDRARLGIILKINVREMVRLAWNEFVLLL
jgi:hypothetical protein